MIFSKINLLKLYIAVSILLSASNASAQNQVPAVRCDNCNISQMIQAGQAGVDVGGVVVYSLPNAEIRAFLITNRTQEIAVPPAAEEYFLALYRFWRENGNSLEMNYDVASGTWDFEKRQASTRMRRAAADAPEKPLPATAYDAIQSTAKLNNAIEKMESTLRAKSYVAYITFVNSVKTDVFGIDAGRPVSVLKFSDGSKLSAAYSADNKRWEMIPGSGRDPHNNFIPEKREDVVKDNKPTIYEFPGGIGSPAYMDFSKQAFYLGIPVTFKPGDLQVICTSRAFDEDIRVEVICMGRR